MHLVLYISINLQELSMNKLNLFTKTVSTVQFNQETKKQLKNEVNSIYFIGNNGYSV